MLFRKTIIILSLLIVVRLSSCGKDYYLEKRTGPYKITNVEIAYYNNHLVIADSSKVYEDDNLGYFNFYHGNPSKIYVVINYPSSILYTDYVNSTYEVHEENYELLTIYNGSSSNARKFTVSGYNRKKQEWTIIKNDYNGKLVRETITVEKQ